MNRRKNFLKNVLAGESRAYGFTIAFWGSGMMLAKYAGLPSIIQALLYGFGAVVGFGVLSLYVYSGPFVIASGDEEARPLVLSMIHYLGALLPLIIAFYTSRLSEPLNFFLTGVQTSLVYNLGMVVEQAVSEEAEKIEKKAMNIF